MLPYKVIFIETTYDSSVKHAETYGKIDGHHTALNLEAFLIEEELNGYEAISITPVISNAAGRMSYPIPVTIGHHVCLRKIKG